MKNALTNCITCEAAYEWTQKNCPRCGTPNKAHEPPELLRIEFEIPLEVWRALVRLGMKRREQPNQTVVQAIEEMISRDAMRRRK